MIITEEKRKELLEKAKKLTGPSEEQVKYAKTLAERLGEEFNAEDYTARTIATYISNANLKLKAMKNEPTEAQVDAYVSICARLGQEVDFDFLEKCTKKELSEELNSLIEQINAVED